MDVDIVITWVDGSDMEWRRKRFPFQPKISPASDVQSYADHGELKVCVKALSLYAPWVRFIWVVHDDCQTPNGLTDKRVRLVAHSQIIPSSHLPTYNSMSIEAYLHRIPGLAEKYVYANDDVFLVRPTTRDTFFDGDEPKVFLTGATHSPAKSERYDIWHSSMKNADLLLDKIEKSVRNRPAHLMFPQLRSVCEEAWQFFEEELNLSTLAKFRTHNCISTQNWLFPWLGILLGKYVGVNSMIIQPYMRCVNNGYLKPFFEKYPELEIRNVYSSC